MAILRHLQRILYGRLDGLVRRRSLQNCLCLSARQLSQYDDSSVRSSALFVSNSVAQHTPPVQIDLDLEHRFSAGLEKLKDSLILRRSDVQLESLIEDFKLLKELKSKKTTLVEQREEIAGMMKLLVQAKVNSDDVKKSKEILISQGKEVRETLKALMPEYWEVEERVMLTALRLPNDLHPQTPKSKEPSVKRKLSFDNTAKRTSYRSHIELGNEHRLLKFSNVGPTSYYLLGELAILEQALQSYVSQTLHDRGFVQLSCPEVFRSAVVEASGVDVYSPNQVYTLSYQHKDEKPHPKLSNSYHLQGVSTSSFTAFLTKTLTETSSLPLRYFSVGRNYSPTDMNYDTGLYGVTQSIQAHVFTGYQRCGDCDEVRGHLEEVTMEMYTDLQLPVRLVSVPADQLTACEAYRSEVQVWSPPFKQYVQVGNISVLGDYISRRLNINVQGKTEKLEHLHMVQGCVMNVTGVLAALLEHRFDESAGRIDIPDTLMPHLSIYM